LCHGDWWPRNSESSSGDPSIAPITVSEARNSFVPTEVVRPGQGLVKAARQG